jgi:hypothetical protein
MSSSVRRCAAQPAMVLSLTSRYSPSSSSEIWLSWIISVRGCSTPSSVSSCTTAPLAPWVEDT